MQAENAIAYDELPEIDQHALFQLENVVKNIKESYESYQFFKIFQVENYSFLLQVDFIYYIYIVNVSVHFRPFNDLLLLISQISISMLPKIVFMLGTTFLHFSEV